MGSPQDLPPSNSSPLPGVSNTVLTLFLAVCGGQHGYVMSRQPHEAELQGCGQRTSSLAFPKVGCLVLVCTWLWSRKQSRGKHIDLSTFSCKEQKAQLKGPSSPAQRPKVQQPRAGEFSATATSTERPRFLVPSHAALLDAPALFSGQLPSRLQDSYYHSKHHIQT